MIPTGIPRNLSGIAATEARQAHNPKVIGSNPIPATKFVKNPGDLSRLLGFVFGDEIGSSNIMARFKSPCNQITS
jgi:hypothetical protein